MTIHIVITFPDGSVRELDLDLCDYTDAERMAEDICTEMADEWAKWHGRRRRKRKSREKYIASCTRWMYPALVSALVEYAQSIGLLPTGGE
jgi:hypothetical protein